MSGSSGILKMQRKFIDILTELGGIAFEEAWKRKEKDYYGKEKVYVLSLEDVIKAKEKAGRPRDKSDLDVLRFAKRKKSKRR